MNPETQSPPKVSRVSRAAAILSGACLTLSFLLSAIFQITRPGIQSGLQPRGIAEPGWLETPSAVFQPLMEVQSAALRVVVLVVFSAFAAALLVALSAFVTLVWMRESGRRGELATRAALGATPRTQLRELSRPVLRALLAGAVSGTLLGLTMNALLRAKWPGTVLEPALAVQLRGIAGVVLVGLLLGAVTIGVLWLLLTRGRLADQLRAGDRITASLADTRVRELLATLQIALCMVLLVLASVLAQQHNEVRVAESGRADAEQVWVRASAAAEADTNAVRRAALVQEALLGAAQMKSALAWSVASTGALLGAGARDRLYSECDNCPRMPTTLRTTTLHSVGPGYFTVLGARLLRGRDFAAGDTALAPPVVIVNDSFVREMFGPRGSGLGRVVRLQLGFGPAHRIVGVVEDQVGRVAGAPVPGEPVAYFSALQHPPARFDQVVRFAGDSVPVLAGFDSLASMSSSAQAAFAYAAAGVRVLAVLCFLLGSYGLYATMILLVRGRRRELGLRLALGSTPARLLRHVGGYALRLVLIGLSIGTVSALTVEGVLALVLPAARIQPGMIGTAALLLTCIIVAGAGAPAWESARTTALLSERSRVSGSASRKSLRWWAAPIRK